MRQHFSKANLKKTYSNFCYFVYQEQHILFYFLVITAFIQVSISPNEVVAVAAGGGPHGDPSAACDRILGYIEGGFGSLVAAAAGLAAIIAAAVGGFKAAWALLVVGVGSFIVRSYITLFLSPCGGSGSGSGS